MEKVVEVKSLSHSYSGRIIYEDLSFSVERGQVLALLGKNGVGKTTLIKILMGFLRPTGGECRILGDSSYNLSLETRRKVAMLFEGHLSYGFMTIESIEKFFAPFYPKWNKELYYSLTEKLRLPNNHKIGNMSEGQRSQVVLGLIMAQQPEVMILDDYTMGLDAGYRALFLDYLKDYLNKEKITVLVTSHIVQDLEQFIDDIIFLERGGLASEYSLNYFLNNFKQFSIPKVGLKLEKGGIFKNIEESRGNTLIYSFSDKNDVKKELTSKGLDTKDLVDVSMTFEEAFIGFTGRY